MFVVEKDMGIGNPPAFLTSIDGETPTWGLLDNAKKFQTEEEANDLIDDHDALVGCISVSFDEPVDLTEIKTK